MVCGVCNMDLPIEMVVEVLSYLPFKQQQKHSRVSWLWYNASRMLKCDVRFTKGCDYPYWSQFKKAYPNANLVISDEMVLAVRTSVEDTLALLSYPCNYDGIYNGKTLIRISLEFNPTTLPYLLSHGLDPNKKCADGESGVTYAIKSKPETIPMLTALGNVMNDDVKLCMRRRPSHLSYFVNHTNSQNNIDDRGWSALMNACANQPSTSHFFSNNDPNRQDEDGRTALIYAVRNWGYPLHLIISVVLQLLSDERLNVNIRDAVGRTALMYAFQRSERLSIILLTDTRHDFSITDNHGNSVFSYISPNFILLQKHIKYCIRKG